MNSNVLHGKHKSQWVFVNMREQQTNSGGGLFPSTQGGYEAPLTAEVCVQVSSQRSLHLPNISTVFTQGHKFIPRLIGSTAGPIRGQDKQGEGGVV